MPDDAANRGNSSMMVDTGLKFFAFMVVCLIAGVVGMGIGGATGSWGLATVIWVVGFLAAWLISAAIRMVTQWQRAIVLSLGKFSGIRGPGLFFITPLI